MVSQLPASTAAPLASEVGPTGAGTIPLIAPLLHLSSGGIGLQRGTGVP